MRLLPTALGLFILPILLCGCGPKTEQESVWIGCIAAFSGGDSSAGVAVKQGVALAVGDSSDLRVEGRRLSVVGADDRGSEETAQAETVRLLSVNQVVALIGGADPGRALHLARAAQPYAAPVILPCECAGPLPGEAVFTLGVRPGWRGQVLAQYASGVLKAKRAFVLIDERNPIAVETASGFVQAWPSGEGRAVEQAIYQADADLPKRAAGAAAAKPDVVLIAASVADLQAAAAQVESSGTHAALLYGGEDVGVAPLTAGRGDLTTATTISLTDLTDRGKEFAGKYQDRFHEAPSYAACLGYDAARVLFEALVRAKGTAPAPVRDALTSASGFDSLTGPLRFKDGRARRRVFVVRLHDGEAKTVQTIDPEADAPAGASR